MTAQEVDLTWPVRECAPWCEQGGGHATEHPDDRTCLSSFRTITLAHGEPEPYIDGIWRVNFCNVYLRREPEATEPDIVVHHEHDDSEIRFTSTRPESSRTRWGRFCARPRSRRIVRGSRVSRELAPEGSFQLVPAPASTVTITRANG